MFSNNCRNASRCTSGDIELFKEVYTSLLRRISKTSYQNVIHKKDFEKTRTCPFHSGKTQKHVARNINDMALDNYGETAQKLVQDSSSNVALKRFEDLPGPRGLPVVGNLLKYKIPGLYSLEKIFENRAIYQKKYGNIYKECLGPLTMVHLFDPEEAMKIFAKEGPCPDRGAQMAPVGKVYAQRNNNPEGLVFKIGDDWIKQRKLIQKLMMDPSAANPYIELQNKIADDFVELIGAVAEDHAGEVQDMLQLMMRYTLESIAGVCFNERLECLKGKWAKPTTLRRWYKSAIKMWNPKQDDTPIAMRMINAVTIHFKCLHTSTFSFPWVNFFRTPLYYRYAKAAKVLEKITDELIDLNDTREVDCLVSYLKRNSKMSKEDLRSLILNFFEAGIDSTAKCLTFMVYNLAKNPSKQEKLYEEIVEVSDSRKLISADDLNNMPYLRACVKESFRVNYPVYAGLARVLPEDVDLCGYNIPKGTFIQVNNATMCKMEQYFHEPNKYQPERWLRDQEYAGIRLSKIMLPFGFGVRNCIGKRFAEQEIMLGVVKIVKEYKLEYHHEDVGMKNEIFTKPDRPVKISFVPRSEGRHTMT